MNERTARTARGNRVGLGLIGILLLAAGGYLTARSLGRLRTRAGRPTPIYSTGAADWVHQQRPWLWITLAAVAVLAADPGSSAGYWFNCGRTACTGLP